MLPNNLTEFFIGSYKYQLLAALTVNLITFSHGIGLGWVSPTLSMLQSEESPFGWITIQEASWVGSCVSIGGLIGNTLFGLIIDRIGRKKTLFLLALPHMIFWTTVFLANEVYHLYIARILAGTTGGGTYVTIPIFIAEIADSKVRGTLGSMFILMTNCGVVMGFIITSYLKYSTVPCVVIILPFLYLLLVCYFPETPQYLLKKGKENEAEISMKFYRNYIGDSKEEFQKFNKDFLNIKNTIQKTNSKDDNRITFKDFTTPAALKGISIGMFLIVLNQFSGTFAIMNYSTTIFSGSGSNMDPKTNTIILGVIQILGTYTSTMLIDRFGRKILLTVSSFGMCLGLTAAGTYSFFAQHYDLSELNWVPVVSLSFVIFIAAIGVSSVPFVVLVEILPGKIRSIASTGCLCMLSILGFAVLKVFPILMEMMNFSGLMWLCSGFCLIGTLIILIFVPETKGKSLDQEQ